MRYIQPDWPAPAQVKAYTTVRKYWGDQAFHTKNEETARSLKTLLQLPEDPVWITQTHSTIAVEAAPENRHSKADASFTHRPNRVCVVLTADCLPILICNKQGTHIAAIHAGWRGLAGGIIETTLQGLMQRADDLLVWLGPAIGPRKFEVENDVYDAFTHQHAETASAFTPHAESKWLANLYALASFRLNLQGVSQIYGGQFCTYSQEDLFFSYRRDKGQTGRMASMIWIDKNYMRTL